MTGPYLFALLVLSIPPRLLAAPDCSACADYDFSSAKGAQAEVLNSLTQYPAAPDPRGMRTAQETWIASRTAECALQTGGSSGGSLREVAHGSCTAKLTRERTVALDQLASYPRGDIARLGRKP